MKESLEDFAKRIAEGPAFLLMGQRYLALEDGTDAFLSELVRKFRASDEAALHSYDDVLDSAAAEDPESSLSWMEDRCRRLSLPEWTGVVSDFPWSGVYTSAIDTIWWSAFRKPWRELQPLFEEKFRPTNQRNRLLLHCTFLFGCVNRTDNGARPPLTQLEWLTRRQIAIALLRRIPELITPRGVLVIEGYGCDLDWLRTEDLVPIVDALNPGQAHIFSADARLAEDPLLSSLVRSNKLVVHPEGLGETLHKAAELGLVRLGMPDLEAGLARRIDIGDGRILSVPIDLWNQVSRSATVMDDSLIADPTDLSADARYSEFRNFLATAEGQNRWTAYARGFAFRRDYSDNLQRIVERELTAGRISDEPFIVHGQTGTGKTISLETLAHNIRQKRKHPVLFIERKIQRPVWSDIDRFCQWAEGEGAPTCLLVWDGMLSPEEYSDFLRTLSGRGRKIILVASSYKIQDTRGQQRRAIEAPAQLTEEESQRFADFLGSFHPELRELVTQTGFARDSSFLVALYRLLPASRTAIRSGVAREIGRAEDLIAKKAKITKPELETATALGYALIAAGIVTDELLSDRQSREIDGEQVSDIQDLTGLVMVPGRFGLKVPLELVVRALGRSRYSNFIELFSDIDIFRWIEDAVGNIDIGPRNQLEARLIVQARMGGPRLEVKYATRILEEVNTDGDDSPDNREVDFAVDLVRAMGSQGQDRTYYSPYWRELSGALQRLREDRGVVSARIMLQEANLLREWAVERSYRMEGSLTAQSQDLTELTSAFDEATSILSSALEAAAKDGRRTRVMRAHLLGELASTLATRCRHSLKMRQPQGEIIRLFNEARRALAEARRADPRSYYPIDILAWSSRDMLTSGLLENEESAEVLADVLSAFETTDEQSLDVTQRERFHTRRLQLGEVLDIPSLADEAFEALDQSGSCAGYFIRALYLSGRLTGRPESREKELASKGLEYLEANWDRIKRDIRCLELNLDLWWLVHTGNRFFASERLTLGLSNTEWQQLVRLIDDITTSGETQRPVVMAYLRAIAYFHLGYTQQSFDEFREVERVSDQISGSRRIVRSYLASTVDGTPKKFHGTVSRLSQEGRRGEVYVEELGRAVPFFPADFGKPEIIRGETLGEFHIAFNFLGPIADAAFHYRG